MDSKDSHERLLTKQHPDVDARTPIVEFHPVIARVYDDRCYGEFATSSDDVFSDMQFFDVGFMCRYTFACPNLRRPDIQLIIDSWFGQLFESEHF